MTPMLKKIMLRLDKGREKAFLSRRNSARVFPGRDISTGDVHKDKILKGTAQRKLGEILLLSDSKTVPEVWEVPGIRMKVQSKLLLALQKWRDFPG